LPGGLRATGSLGFGEISIRHRPYPHIETPFSRTSVARPVTNFSGIVRPLYNQPESDRFGAHVVPWYSARPGSIGPINNYPT
jgi:hypothetical protein